MQTHRSVEEIAGETGALTAEFVAPARVNLLGEHTDYSGGYVLPMAIPFTTVATITARADGRCGFSSDQFEERRTISVDDRSSSTGVWCDYPIGVLRQLQALDLAPAGFDLHLAGSVPFGAGLSSSASVEVASAIAMLWLARKTMKAEEIALLCQRAENQYVNSPCGIMDQFVITMAKAGNALMLNTRTLEYEHIPMNHGGLASTCVVVCNSMVKHSIAGGEYGLRRREVEAGQSVLQADFGVQDLGGSTLEQLEASKSKMSTEAYRRCRHAISENGRVLQAKQAMQAGDPVQLGKLMVAAHASLRDDFACSCTEIDFLVETATKLEGCYGARMTGGGFGGCTVNLVAREHAESFSAALKHAYRDLFHIDADTYVCEAVDGAMHRNADKISL